MTKVLLAMLAMFVLIVPLGGVWELLLQPLMGGSVAESFLYPLYGGCILLAGLIVACTVVILEEIRSLKK